MVLAPIQFAIRIPTSPSESLKSMAFHGNDPLVWNQNNKLDKPDKLGKSDKLDELDKLDKSDKSVISTISSIKQFLLNSFTDILF